MLYEDQGGMLRLTAGDCFIQPPEIRHRVLQASDGIEVIEIGVPAEHVTEIDHEMTLPTPHVSARPRMAGAALCPQRRRKAASPPFRMPGFEARDTTITREHQGRGLASWSRGPSRASRFLDHA